MDHAEAAARERTRAIPDGVYEAKSFMDDDAVDVAKRIPIRVKVIVAGDEMTVDLTEVAKQVRGFYNPDRPPASPARRSPSNVSPRRRIIRSMTARSAT